MVIRLVKVHEHGHLVEQCITLLNEEWPREAASRRRTLSKSSDRLNPLCLACIETADDHDDQAEVIGFVKLTSERSPFDRDAGRTVFLESLVVAKSRRGQGHGRYIMEEVESMLRQLKLDDELSTTTTTVDRINLTTTDKVSFYERMGFRRATPASEAMFAEEQMPTSQQKPEKDESFVSGHLPPPPPPPISMFTSLKITPKNAVASDATSTLPKVFMYKNIK